MAKPNHASTPWYVIDAAGKTLGRIATQIASHLRGKTNSHFTPHVLTGPTLIVVNADKIQVTGKKLKEKHYEHYTGYPGGLKSERFETVFAKFPARVLEKAVKGMLPKNPLGRAAFRRLKVYPGEKHPHGPQHPKIMVLQ